MVPERSWDLPEESAFCRQCAGGAQHAEAHHWGWGMLGEWGPRSTAETQQQINNQHSAQKLKGRLWRQCCHHRAQQKNQILGCWQPRSLTAAVNGLPVLSQRDWCALCVSLSLLCTGMQWNGSPAPLQWSHSKTTDAFGGFGRWSILTELLLSLATALLADCTTFPQQRDQGIFFV